jgi:hypothetical protein
MSDTFPWGLQPALLTHVVTLAHTPASTVRGSHRPIAATPG